MCLARTRFVVYCWSLARELWGIIKVQKKILMGVIYVKNTVGKRSCY